MRLKVYKFIDKILFIKNRYFTTFYMKTSFLYNLVQHDNNSHIYTSKNLLIYYFSTITNSVRLFLALPSSVSLDAIGWLEPNPFDVNLEASMSSNNK